MIRSGLLSGLTVEMDFAHHTQRWLGLQERELYPWFRRLTEGVRTAIDVGANDGIYTLYFLAKTPAEKVLAFEPSPDSLDQLRKQPRLERLRRKSPPGNHFEIFRRIGRRYGSDPRFFRRSDPSSLPRQSGY